ncbi:MarR family winged helix-turn-helix transcriptional regulator [Phaeocystidibacter luteus]|uniref:MarR family transcriptional regulator n=1 Tax=Phaeocystidibacter luteus TaxID=911197 RepID=A0A6N6RLS7_9FLAO|nr:MarR family transcriptional regulator [Phaeocystidibacter luteus]KAB2814544.1 MarR family transcriptional regulator [Phaeocystidibacter luteus]
MHHSMNDVIGKIFFDLSKEYVAQVTDRLQHLDIERHYYALYLLDRAESTLTQSELSELLEVDKVAVVRLVDYLTEAGYVKRKVDDHDRRKQHVILQPKAEEVLPEIREAFSKANENLLEVLNEKDKKDFLRIAARIRDFYEENPLHRIKVNMNYKRVKV